MAANFIRSDRRQKHCQRKRVVAEAEEEHPHEEEKRSVVEPERIDFARIHNA
jgi:hypothetical protein